MIPELSPVLSWDAALGETRSCTPKLLLVEKGASRLSLRHALGDCRPERVILMVGPEGGFDNEEIQRAMQSGYVPVSLGPRILRTETASIVGAALVQHLLGGME
jgi:16S rRNA (uracil1498-N3)-methyltransferase